MFSNGDSDDESDAGPSFFVEPPLIVKDYCSFLKTLKNQTCDNQISCLCSSILKNKKSFSKHKNSCKLLKTRETLYNEFILNFLPANGFYNDVSKSIVYDGPFDQWFENLNRGDHKYIILTTRNDNAKNLIYKSIACHVYEVKKCESRFNIIFNQDDNKILISPLCYHNHSPFDHIIDTNGKKIPILLRNKRLDFDVKEKLISYFYDGLTPSAALENLKLESQNYEEESKYRCRIPYLRTVFYLFEKERNISFGPADICNASLQSLENEFKSSLRLKHTLNSEKQYIIAFCSLKMLGSVKVKEISEKVICIDSTGGMDRTSGHLFNLVIPGPTGALSIGMFITFSESKSDIVTGLNLLKQIWADNGLSDFNPKCFMTDDSAPQIGAISEVFPLSRILLCLFHVAQALWRWLQSNGTKSTRQSVINNFSKVVYSNNFNDSKQKFFDSIQGNQSLVNHFNKVFKKEKMFGKSFRKELNLMGVDTNNLVERSFLEVKQKFLERNKVYNVIQLIQQIVIKYESLTKIKLIDFKNHRQVNTYKEYMNVDKNIGIRICKFILDSKFAENQSNTETMQNAIPDIDFDHEPEYEPDIPPEIENFFQENNLNSNSFEQIDEGVDIEKFNEAIEILKTMSQQPENANVINKWSNRLLKAKTNTQKLNVMATGGVTNKNILKVQSRIAKNSHKNRFPSLQVKNKVSKPRSLSYAVKHNIRNKMTQSKK